MATIIKTWEDDKDEEARLLQDYEDAKENHRNAQHEMDECIAWEKDRRTYMVECYNALMKFKDEKTNKGGSGSNPF